MKRYGRTLATTAGALALAALAAGCGGSATGAAPQSAPSGPATGTAPGSGAGSDATAGAGSGMATDPAVWAKWGLTPLPPTPAAPSDKPVKLTRTGKVPVFRNIPTDQKVVFITLDDGAEKDPRFVQMMQDLRIPFTMFLMNDTIKSDYGYFKPLQALGNSIQNHTLHHPAMSTISEARQQNEICGDQKIITTQYGTAPFLFRPPYGDGAYSANLNTAVQACGPRAVVYWKETMQITGFQYQGPDHRLQNGDIILAHFRGPSELKGESMTAMFANMVKRIQEQGFTVARLDDYIQQP
ncbi:polysaccharide deacetylase family protein [Streptacidiphilus sp. EB129]|uniref:polysaccharide deacetylase family protein n=1 Tax=Streptacidiphilus sp. EB129 TaxID=3156262 RepID=UPI003517D466